VEAGKTGRELLGETDREEVLAALAQCTGILAAAAAAAAAAAVSVPMFAP